MNHSEYFNTTNSRISDGFSVAVAALLTAANAENCLSIFKENNIGIKDISELSEIDLIVMGVDSVETREKILNSAKQLPLSTQNSGLNVCKTLTASDVTKILSENERHLYRIYLSLGATKILLKRSKCDDIIIYPPTTFSTDILLKSIDRLQTLLDDTGKELDALKSKTSKERKKYKQRRSMLIAAGGFTLAVLSVYFVKSIKDVMC